MSGFSPTRLWAVARKEFLHIIRDARSMGMAVAIPLLLLVLFGEALTLDVDNVPVAVWDQSGTPASREFVSRFAASRYFSVRSYVHSYRELEVEIDTRRTLAGLVIPREFAQRVGTGRLVEAQMIVDGSDSNTATIALGYADAVARRYSEQLAISEIHRQGGRELVMPLQVRPRVWFNAEMESRNYVIPGLTAVIMMVIAALLTSLTIAREWERGTMEQLISTPIKGYELIIGKLVPYFAIAMLDVLLAVLMGELLFRVPLRGNAALVFASAAVFLAGALPLGMVISIIAKKQLAASQIAMVTTFLPSFLLSGFVYAISNMPAPIRALTYFIPARYFVILLKGIYLKGVGLSILGGELGLLALFSAAMLALANMKFRKKL